MLRPNLVTLHNGEGGEFPLRGRKSRAARDESVCLSAYRRFPA